MLFSQGDRSSKLGFIYKIYCFFYYSNLNPLGKVGSWALALNSWS